MHASLHGMGFSEGALLLIEKRWLGTDRDQSLRAGFAQLAESASLRLHDHDRGGDKGFRYGGPGFWSTPEGTAMRQHFLDGGDPDTAALFRQSTMETAVALGGEPLCVVTELPLFVLTTDLGRQPGVPVTLLAFQDAMPRLVEAAGEGQDLARLVTPFGLRALDLETQVRMHLATLDLALAAVAEPNGR